MTSGIKLHQAGFFSFFPFVTLSKLSKWEITIIDKDNHNGKEKLCTLGKRRCPGAQM